MIKLPVIQPISVSIYFWFYSSSRIIFSSLTSILYFCTLRYSLYTGLFSGFHDWIPASELPRKPEVSGGIWTAVQSWTLLLHCISYGIISLCVFTLCSQELEVKWLCKQVWQFQVACVSVCAETLPRRLVTHFGFWEMQGGVVHCTHRESSNFERVV